MRPNKDETAVQWFRMSRTILPGFSGHGNSIYNNFYVFVMFGSYYLKKCLFLISPPMLIKIAEMFVESYV